jgi:hypothetical protein
MTDVETAHKRLDMIEATVKTHQDELSIIRASLDNNTRITQEVATNTAELVTLFKGSKAVYRLFISLGTVTGLLLGLYYFLKNNLHL